MRWLLRNIGQRLANRTDSEHEQAIIRVVLVALLATYFGILTMTQGAAAPGAGTPSVGESSFLTAAIFAIGYTLLGCVYFGWIVIQPRAMPIRRVMGMVTDQTTLSVLMYLGGVWGGPLYPIFLWITFGNGFRYGNKYLLGAATLSVVGFALVGWFNPFWHDHLALTVGLVLGLIVLPVYVATLIRKLTEAKRSAEAANHAKSRFLATMSHELRTPLNAVIGLSDLLSAARLEREQAEMVSLIGSSGRVLLALINDVLDIAKIEAGKGEVREVDFDLVAELDRSLAILRPQAEQKGLRLALALDSTVPVRARGDIQHLRQALLNLVSNAIKFTESGGVVLHAQAEMTAHGHWLTLAVEDSGIGIDESDLERIFEAFRQSDEASNRRYGGTGLGLAIARGLAEAMGGSLDVESAKGTGSTFTLGLPLATPLGPSEAMPPVDGTPLHLVMTGAPSPETAVQFESAGACLAERNEGAAGQVICFDLRGPAGSDEETSDWQWLVQLASGIGHDRASLVLTRDRSRLHRDLAFALGRSIRIAPPLEQSDLRNSFALIAALSAVNAKAEAVETGLDDVPQTQSAHVLVVEDNPVNRKVTAKILERGGHIPVVVGSGEAAMDVLEAGEIDAILMDVNMPGENGIETAKLYRFTELGSDRRLPILALTADATVETRQACLDAGMDDFITKPVDAFNLLRTLNQHLSPDAGTPAPSRLTIDDGQEVAARSPALDHGALATLLELDPTGDFLSEIVAEFVVDTDTLLAELDIAIASADRARVQDILHALRSSAGHVGAARLRARAIALARTIAVRGTNQTGEALALLRADAEAYRTACSGYAGPMAPEPASDSEAQIIPLPVGPRLH